MAASAVTLAAERHPLHLPFAQAMRALGPFEPVPHLAVACSGGADSMACLLLAQQWAHAQGGRVTALTVDHRLRAESTSEAQQVAAWCAARGIAHQTLTPSHAPAGNNLQEAARQWRYDALADWCRAQQVLHCLIAHHAEDQAETQQLAAARGTTEDGPAGMSALRLYRGVRFLRPLLAHPKAALTDFLQHESQAWVDDPSNRNPRFARARLRQHAPQPVDHAARDARIARERALAEAAAACVRLHPLGHGWLDLASWGALPEALATQLLADLLTSIGGQIHRPRAAHTYRLADALRSPAHTPQRHTLHHCLIVRSNGTALIAREPARVAPPMLLHGRGNTAWDGRFRLHYALPAGITLQLRALGADGKHALRARGVAWAATLPASAPSLWHLDACLFVPHMEESPAMLQSARLKVGFAPAKPLAARSFW